MKTAFEFLKHFTEDLLIYPDGTSDKDIIRFRNAILKAMENFAKQEVNKAVASKATAILPHLKHRFSIDDPIIVKASLDIRSEYVCSNPLRKPGEIDRQLKGYLVEFLNSLNGA